MHEANTSDTERVDRRGMLRKASAVVAGAAGAAVAGAVAATPAHAAPGDPVVQGAENDALTSSTTLRNDTTVSEAGPTLALENNAYTTDGTYSYGGAAVALKPSQAYNLPASTPAGSMMMGAGGYLMIATPDGQGGAYPYEYVYHSLSANFTVPITPYRVVDTRSDRSNLYGSGALDSSGRLMAGKTVHLDLSDLVTYADAVFINITTTGSLKRGYLTVWPTGQERPNASTINYPDGVSIANGVLAGVGYDDIYTDALSFYSNQTTHFIVDVGALVIGHIGQLGAAVMGSAKGFLDNSAEAGAQHDDRALARRKAALATKLETWAKQRG